MKDFVAGPENLLAIPALQRLLADDLTDIAGVPLFNPLVLLGSSGTGKSFLAQGITRHWRSKLGDAAVQYFSAVDFARELSAAREAGELREFRQRLADLHLFVLEDFHKLPLRAFVQREVRDTLEVLLEADAAIVITTQQPPAAISTGRGSGLEAGLRDRLAGGLTLRLHDPGIEARLEILQQTASDRGVQIDPDQLQQLAHKFDGTIPQLYRSIAAYEFATADQPLDVSERTPLRFKQILAVVARYYSLTQAALCSPARRKSLVYARSVAIYLARLLTDQSYAQIGQALGRRDHSTIMHACTTLENRLSTDAATQQDIEELKRILTAS